MNDYEPIDQREAAIKIAKSYPYSAHEIMRWIMFFEEHGYKLCRRKEDEKHE